MPFLAVIALAAVMLMGISHLVALRSERHRTLPRVIDNASLNIHRPRRG